MYIILIKEKSVYIRLKIKIIEKGVLIVKKHGIASTLVFSINRNLLSPSGVIWKTIK